MAAEDITTTVVSGAGDLFAGVIQALQYITVIGAIVGLIALFWWLKKFKYDFEVRKRVKNGDIITRLKAKIVKDKNGKEIFKFIKPYQGHKYWKAPPVESQTVNTKGRIDVKAYYIENVGFQYIEFPQEVKSQVNAINSDDREFMAMQQAIANEEGGNSWWDKHGTSVIALGTMLIFVVCLMVFWSDIAQPVLEAKELDQKTIELQTQLIEKIDGIINERQRIPTEQPNTGNG